ncbi:acetyl/propionyl/methylcrotonyl-CoA carboxylase subunit alpha [Croceibacterium sp. LX-88]|uniref:Acetyl/propionyl/methylcrotonyl-CoA carboxylase subunit alpha n=1 Tax=Croceibacterium selenioxidans TaxID=2838833 RepID=A0ABS5VZT6_9SPHN|nr:acetyl/propionyl/methylcrotonyl-CoA carboxylase subunit alpha [Croceibacterium selenioxidans]MBT2132721.1 acetyl/propionyl/methylcrotonyl-CoA carboxylase subunit alpha [Croceibacterium selenioxidans]
MIRSLLIANRGEIACRVIRTAREMGIRTIAVYSDADARALHVRQADEAVHIGPSAAAESYLRGETIIEAALATGAEAIHPGYGFLSENAEFAEAVMAAGLIWVGPRPASIRAMGLKDAAKKLMQDAGVPVTPGYMGDDQSPERLLTEAEAIGWPVLIKAVAGGGGKGMRKVDAADQFLDMLESCQREAKASFGNAEVLLERWITSPRHIEVQVFGDTHGSVVHLFERDCSLQRRHQKVIEEAPAPGMNSATREAICAAAVRAAKAVDYVGAGTIEFIADAREGLSAERIFFMEMNTRLQVEHPVTEEITGVDLVEWQLRVASGEALPKRQEELSIKGWAMEARLYAEDPATGFLPSTGRLDRLHFPSGVRIETGVEEGDAISPFYDPMIAKLVASAEDRETARRVLSEACGETSCAPVKTNAWFLKRLLETEQFAIGKVETGFIADHEETLTTRSAPSERSLSEALDRLLRLASHGDPRVTGLAAFRLNSRRQPRQVLNVDGHPTEFTYTPTLPGQDARQGFRDLPQSDAQLLSLDGDSFVIDWPRAEGTSGASVADGAIVSPMPGKVIAVDVAEGEIVSKGQRLLVLEAMKMEHSLTAPFTGTVAELKVAEGQQVQVEALLARVEKGA